MPRFFCEYFSDNPVISGPDGKHIARSLRMKAGEQLTVCDTKGTDYDCQIEKIEDDTVFLKILSSKETLSEPTVKVTLFQCMPKGDKLDYVVQKAVELGVTEIVPVLSSRCVSRPDAKSYAKKRERLQKIADEAAKQSGRGICPKIHNMISFNECCSKLCDYQKSIVFYELGGEPLTRIIDKDIKNVAVLIGSEGGFSVDEIDLSLKSGAVAATLGKRILRTETAPIAALTGIMLLSGNME